jgi:ketosteroid isomerase-like protein
MDRRDAVVGYYDAIDEGAYDRLAALLTPGFVHRRPDRTLDGRERFVRFMREERPRTDTEHVLTEMCVSADEAEAKAKARTETEAEATVFAEGRLVTVDGDDMFGFVDVHRVGGGGIESLTTYTA